MLWGVVMGSPLCWNTTHINWSLAQAHSVGLSQSFPPKRGGKARPWTGFQFTVHKRPMSGSVLGTSGASFPK